MFQIFRYQAVVMSFLLDGENISVTQVLQVIRLCQHALNFLVNSFVHESCITRVIVILMVRNEVKKSQLKLGKGM